VPLLDLVESEQPPRGVHAGFRIGLTPGSLRLGPSQKIGKVHLSQDLTVGDDGGAHQKVLQLPDVAGPAVLPEDLHHFPGDPGNVLVKLLVDLLDQEVDEDGDVLAPLPQRGDRDGHDVEAVVKIVPELALFHHGLEVPVRGGDDPRADLDPLFSPDPLELHLLEHAQELRLKVDGHLADLVEKHRAESRQLELSQLSADGARERSLLVAEELRFEQGLDDGGAVDGDVGLVFVRVVVDDLAMSSFPVPLSPG
jgi:hypothetical protein